MQDFILEQLNQTFSGRESLSRQELFDFFRRFEPDLKETTFRWRIYSLKEKNIITPISRKRFTLTHKPTFVPELGEQERRISSLIRKQLRELKFAVWSTGIVNEFMLHQPTRFITLVEVEKDAVEPVFYLLKDSTLTNVFLEPGEKEIDKYVSGLENAVVVLPLVSKAAIQKIKDTATTTIEKLLVDLFCDRQLFNAFQGSELAHIYNNAYNRYSIDFTKLFGYATRRGKTADLKKFLQLKTDIPKTIFDD